MAQNTPLTYQNLVIYEIYVRNHGPNGTFSDVEADLERIKALGVDILWFMPIHPIGKINRKGKMGCPYSISNYREVNPEYGTKEDFSRLIQKAHSINLRIMIDVVYNHTAHDSILVKNHPDWYHQDPSGKPMTTVPEWSDVIDLNYENPDLDDYLCDTLAYWVKFGVDGFRCDVASLVPVDFWRKAHDRCAKINPETIWLAESVHAGFIRDRRQVGLHAVSDSELYQAGFDLTYDYDIWPLWDAVVMGNEPVQRYLEMLRYQDCIYPSNFVKMRCVENHDQVRIMQLAKSKEQALAWTAFQVFNRGAFLIYDGQESAADHPPSLFEIDKISWGSYELTPFFRRLFTIKKDPVFTSGSFNILSPEPVIVAAWESAQSNLLGIFNVNKLSGPVSVPLPDGEYENLIDGKKIQINNGALKAPKTAAIVRYEQSVHPKYFYSNLFDMYVPRDPD